MGWGAESKFKDQFQCFFPTCQTSLMNVLGVVDSSRQAARGAMKREQALSRAVIPVDSR